MQNKSTRQQSAQQFFDNLMDSSPRSISKRISAEVYPAYRVLRVDGRFADRALDYEIALVNTNTREIAYYLDVAHLGTDLRGKPAIHALTYRSTDAAYKVALEGFATSVMFDCLVPDHTVILADGNLSAGGQFLWHARLSEAIHYGRKSYFIQADGHLRRLESGGDHQILTDEIWLAKNAGLINLAAVSSRDLVAQIDHESLACELKQRMSVCVNELILQA